MPIIHSIVRHDNSINYLLDIIYRYYLSIYSVGILFILFTFNFTKIDYDRSFFSNLIIFIVFFLVCIFCLVV